MLQIFKLFLLFELHPSCDPHVQSLCLINIWSIDVGFLNSYLRNISSRGLEMEIPQWSTKL
jgi:hypothetical protein